MRSAPPPNLPQTNPEAWATALYDETDDCFYTYSTHFVEGKLIYEMVALSPLATAHERLEHRPELFDVIFAAQEAQRNHTVYDPDRGFPRRAEGSVPEDMIGLLTLT